MAEVWVRDSNTFYKRDPTGLVFTCNEPKLGVKANLAVEIDRVLDTQGASEVVVVVEPVGHDHVEPVVSATHLDDYQHAISEGT